MYRYIPWSKRPADKPVQPPDDFVVLDMPLPRSPSPSTIPPPELVAVRDDPQKEATPPPPPPLDYWETMYTVGVLYIKIVTQTVKKYWNEFQTFMTGLIGG